MKKIILLFPLLFCLLPANDAFCDVSGKLPVKEMDVKIASGGKALLPVVISTKASGTMRKNAEVLASVLSKMTGGEFKVEQGDASSRGIIFGKQEDFTALPSKADFAPQNPERTEEYFILTDKGSLFLVGATDLAVQNAMWDFLGRQGYRQYFPGRIWEVIPKKTEISATINEVQKPSYLMRSVWFSGGAYPEDRRKYDDWQAKNRQASSFHISAGHSYEGFINSKKKDFAEHPEYFALVDGKRRGPKLNIANPDLRKLFVDHALSHLKKNPQALSVSADPSDGGGWDESEEAKAIGTPSDQALFLANEVARALQKDFPGKYVGMYAYNFHSAPPSIRAEKNVFVLVTTAFRGTRLGIKEQMEGWHAQGAKVGIRDYFSYAAANYDIPARCLRFESTPDVLAKIKKYHDWGARVYSSESGNNWVINGLVYYSAARALWDVGNTAFAEKLMEEFLNNCFGSCADDIRTYYQALSSAGNPVLEPGFFHTLYAALEAARARKPGEEIEARLDALTLYARYLELYRAYSCAPGNEARIKAAKEMINHLYRSRFQGGNAGYAIIRDFSGRDQILSRAWTPEERKKLRAGDSPWASANEKAIPREEILAMSADGLRNNPPLPFRIISFSRDLVPAESILKAEKNLPKGKIGGQGVHSLMFYTYAENPGTEWRIKISCSTKSGKNAAVSISPSISLWSDKEPEGLAVDKAEVEIQPGTTGELVVKTRFPGLHRIILEGARWQKLELDPERPWTLTSDSDTPAPSQGASETGDLYFYVPKGTRVLGAHIPGRGVLINPLGKPVMSFDKNGYVKIDIPEGQSGRLWRIKDIRGGNFNLLTVPPYFAPSAKDLLLPKEVVEKDAGKN